MMCGQDWQMDLSDGARYAALWTLTDENDGCVVFVVMVRDVAVMVTFDKGQAIKTYEEVM